MSVDADFLLAFTHDLRQPLRAMMTQAQRLQRQLDVETAPARLDDIVAAARRQEELIAGAIEFAQAELDPANLMALGLTLQTACLKVDAYRQQQGGIIRVDLDVAARRRPVPAGFARVLEKVLHNALKFHRAGVSPEVDVVGTETELRIVDNGLGIEPQFRETVFEPFRRLHPASEFPGAGLGLAISRRLMNSIGGVIAIADSDAGCAVSMQF